MAHRKVVQEVQEREGIKPQLGLLNQLKGDDPSQEEEDAEASKAHVRVDEADALQHRHPCGVMSAQDSAGSCRAYTEECFKQSILHCREWQARQSMAAELREGGHTPYLKSRTSTKVISPTMTTKMRALITEPASLVPVESSACRNTLRHGPAACEGIHHFILMNKWECISANGLSPSHCNKPML